MGLATGSQIVPLGAHVLNLGQLQRAVLLGLGQRGAGNVGMDMNLKAFVVLTDDQTVANAVQIGPQRLQRLLTHGFADDEHSVKGEGDLVLQGGKIRLFLDLGLLAYLGDGFTPQAAQHAAQNDKVTLAAGIYHAGLFQHGIHLHRFGQRDFTGANGLFQHEFHTVILLRGLNGPLGRQTGNGQHRTLGGFHHRAVSRGDAFLHGGGQRRAVRFGQPLEGFGHAAEEKRQDHAGVAPGAAQQTACRDLGGIVDGFGVGLFQFGAGGLDGQTHVGAGVTVRHRENVQVVDGLLLSGNAGRAEQHHILECGTVNFFCHLV